MFLLKTWSGGLVFLPIRKMFKSDLKNLGVVQLPIFSGTRVMMMPFLLEDVMSIPGDLERWRGFVASITQRAGAPRVGTAYLTIDEQFRV